jgi:hypothetical protein
MDIPSVLISDTNGSLASDLFKIHVDNPTISASLTDEVSKSRMLTVALDNVSWTQYQHPQLDIQNILSL